MTKLEQLTMHEALANIKPIPGFDSQKWFVKYVQKFGGKPKE